MLATTDAVTSTLDAHKLIQESGWDGDIRPTYRADAVINMDGAWHQQIDAVGRVTQINIHDYTNFIDALEQQRRFFKQTGATTTDHAMLRPFTQRLSSCEADAIFQRGLNGYFSAEDAERFTAHMLMETSGLYNTVGFNDDTRVFPSIPARHDLARRVDVDWLANLVVRHVIDRSDAEEIIEAASYGLAKQAYNFT